MCQNHACSSHGPPLNEDIAGRLDEVARMLTEQGANRFRAQAHRQAARVLRLAGPEPGA